MYCYTVRTAHCPAYNTSLPGSTPCYLASTPSLTLLLSSPCSFPFPPQPFPFPFPTSPPSPSPTSPNSPSLPPHLHLPLPPHLPLPYLPTFTFPYLPTFSFPYPQAKSSHISHTCLTHKSSSLRWEKTRQKAQLFSWLAQLLNHNLYACFIHFKTVLLVLRFCPYIYLSIYP